jgi:hypothetical protein
MALLLVMNKCLIVEFLFSPRVSGVGGPYMRVIDKASRTVKVCCNGDSLRAGK